MLFDEATNTAAAGKAKREKLRLDREADTLLASLATEQERLNAKLARAAELYDKGALSAEEYARVQERLKETTPALADSFNDLAHSISSTFIGGITQAESFLDIVGSVEQTILRIGNRAVEQALGDALEDLFRRRPGGTSTPAIATSPDMIGLSGVGRSSRGFLDDLRGFAGSVFADSVFADIFHEGGTAGSKVAARRRVPALAFAGAPRLAGGTFPGLKRDEMAAILHRNEIVLNPAQSDAARAMAVSGPRERRGLNISFGDIVIQGGAGGVDPGFTADQITAELADRLRAIEDEL